MAITAMLEIGVYQYAMKNNKIYWSKIKSIVYIRWEKRDGKI